MRNLRKLSRHQGHALAQGIYCALNIKKSKSYSLNHALRFMIFVIFFTNLNYNHDKNYATKGIFLCL
jgi:hypothetical protein